MVESSKSLYFYLIKSLIFFSVSLIAGVEQVRRNSHRDPRQTAGDFRGRDEATLICI